MSVFDGVIYRLEATYPPGPGEGDDFEVTVWFEDESELNEYMRRNSEEPAHYVKVVKYSLVRDHSYVSPHDTEEDDGSIHL